MLNRIEYGDPASPRSLLIVHGLFGSGRNWGAVAKRLADMCHVVSVDQRNHGESGWTDTHSYGDMAEDLAEVIEDLQKPVDVVGHSMGGKAAMALALTRPALVASLLVADIAPVAYTHTQTQFIEAMRGVDLSKVTKRSEAMDQLAATVDDPTLRSFFTQSLDLKEKRWRLNLDTLDREMPGILGFPTFTSQYDGPTLFLSGADSDYVRHAHRPDIRALFPKARFAKITGAGHWLHAEKPREFVATVRGWLDSVQS